MGRSTKIVPPRTVARPLQALTPHQEKLLVQLYRAGAIAEEACKNTADEGMQGLDTTVAAALARACLIGKKERRAKGAIHRMHYWLTPAGEARARAIVTRPTKARPR